MSSLFLPTLVRFPLYPKPLSYLTPRLSSVSGILACWMLGTMKPRKWHVSVYVCIPAVFFTFLYIDTGIQNSMEEQVERLVKALPAGRRVVSDIDSGDESRVVSEHIVDRGCIGRCFSYDNYEPSSGMFRVRATPGNTIVEAEYPNGSGSQSSEDFAKLLNPPVLLVSRCDANAAKICMRELSPDEIHDLIEDDHNGHDVIVIPTMRPGEIWTQLFIG